MIRYLSILIFNLIFCLGIESITLPHHALEIASANSGIGHSKNIGINFAAINNLNNSFSASSIIWYQGVKGSNLDYKWGKEVHHYINLYNLSANDIDLRDDVPNDDPIDLFDIHHISLGYGFGKKLSNKLNIGIKNTLIYNQLYTDEAFGYNLDLGISYSYNPLLSFGIIINQLGFEKTEDASLQYPLLAGIGTTLHLNSLKTQINTDFIYDDSIEEELIFKLGTITKTPYLSIITGYHFSDSKNEFSCGFSFKYRKIQFDYGISFHSALGNPAILSLKYHI